MSLTCSTATNFSPQSAPLWSQPPRLDESPH